MKKHQKTFVIGLSILLLTACGASNSAKTPAASEAENQTSVAAETLPENIAHEKKDPIGAEIMKEEYVDAVLRVQPGSAGSSLKEVQVAYEVLYFADSYDLMNVDRDQAAADLQRALDSLSDEDRKTFVENEKRVNEVILQSTSAEDFGEYKGAFEDAGVYDDMVIVTGNENALENWQVLHSITTQVLSAQ